MCSQQITVLFLSWEGYRMCRFGGHREDSPLTKRLADIRDGRFRGACASRRGLPTPIGQDCPLRVTEKVVYTADTPQSASAASNGRDLLVRGFSKRHALACDPFLCGMAQKRAASVTGSPKKRALSTRVKRTLLKGWSFSAGPAFGRTRAKPQQQSMFAVVTDIPFTWRDLIGNHRPDRACCAATPDGRLMREPAKIRAKWLTVAGLFLMAGLLATPEMARAQAAGSQTRRVVILNATDPYLPAFLALDSALRDVIGTESKVPTELYAEALDMHRFPRELLEQDEVAMLRKKYRGLNVDVVVATAPIALDFVQRHRKKIWPGATIVFNSVPTALLRDRTFDHATIGVPVQLDFGPTLDLALKLRPETRRIAVVGGIAEPDRRHLSNAQVSLERYAERIDVEYLVGLTLAETVAALRGLPSDSVVLYLTMFRDGGGIPRVPRDVLAQIAEVSHAPVFGVFDSYGIAAGSITTFAEQGRRTGELVARVLNGEDPSAIGIQPVGSPRCIADWRQLGHWGIDEDLLPADCEV